MLVSEDPVAMISPKGWKSRALTLDLCPERVLRTVGEEGLTLTPRTPPLPLDHPGMEGLECVVKDPLKESTTLLLMEKLDAQNKTTTVTTL